MKVSHLADPKWQQQIFSADIQGSTLVFLFELDYYIKTVNSSNKKIRKDEAYYSIEYYIKDNTCGGLVPNWHAGQKRLN